MSDEATARNEDSRSDESDDEVRAQRAAEEIKALRAAVANLSNYASLLEHEALLAVALWSEGSQPADLDEAISTFRKCLASWPPEHPKRPTVLFTLSAALKDRFDRDGQRSDLDNAVSAGREAIKVRRQVGMRYSPTYGTTFAEALWARFVRDDQPADLDELLEVTQETVDAASPGHPQHQLAACNLALALTARASRTKELREVNRALRANRYLHEILSVSSPRRARDQLESGAARSLTSLGADLLGMGRPSDALAATEQAIAILRRLAETNPAAYEPDLAGALQNLGIGLSGVGRLAEALGAIKQAVAIRRRLAETHPAHGSDLAHSLNILGVLERVVGNDERSRQERQ